MMPEPWLRWLALRETPLGRMARLLDARLARQVFPTVLYGEAAQKGVPDDRT